MRHVNKIHNEISPHTGQSSHPSSKGLQILVHWKGCGKTKLSDTVGAAVENSMEFSLKTKNRAALLSSNPSSGYISSKNEKPNVKRYMHSLFHSSTIYYIQDVRTPQMLMNRKFACVIYIPIYKYAHTQWSITQL